MLSVPAQAAIFLCTEPTDLRKGINGLSGIVRGEFQSDPIDGSLYMFVNRRRDRLKILHFDGSGFWLYYKRLEAGTFEVLACDDPCVEIDTTQLAMLLGGVSLASAEKRVRETFGDRHLTLRFVNFEPHQILTHKENLCFF